MSSDIQEMKTTLSSLKEKIKKMAKMCESIDFNQNDAYAILSDGLIDIIDIKRLNSKIQFEVENSKDECNKEQTKAEQKNLSFQNYIYQKENIINQIHQCDSFQTPQISKIYDKNEDIKMVTVEKLNNELLNRKRLFDKCNEITSQKEKNLTIFSEKENYIKSLPNYLNSINTNSSQAQSLLNANLYQKLQKEKLTPHLPQPLYVLFYSFLSTTYEKDDSPENKVKLIGNENEIENFYNEYPNEKQFKLNTNNDKENNKEEGEQSDEGEITVKNNYNTNDTLNGCNVSGSIQNIKKFPLYIEYSVNDKIKILFKYIAILGIITVEAISTDKSSKFTTNELLSNIFDYKPNYIISNKINNEIEDINHLIANQCENFSKNEMFYEYIQILSNNSTYNINNLFNHNEYTIIYDNTMSKHSINEITISNFISEVSKRAEIIPNLKKEINYLKNNKKVIDCKNQYKSIITNVENDNYQNYYKNIDGIYKTIVYFDIDSQGNLFKILKQEKNKKYAKNEAEYLKIEIKNENFKILALAEIGYDYPKNLPQFKIKIELINSADKSSYNANSVPKSLQGLISVNCNEINDHERKFYFIEKQFEEEINEITKQEIKNNNNIYLSFQIEKLIKMCDLINQLKNNSKDYSNYDNIIKDKEKLINFLNN